MEQLVIEKSEDSLAQAASLVKTRTRLILALIISRAIQGIGAAISTATAFAILVTTFPEGRERNRALGIFVSVLSAGFAAGSVSGGILTSAFGWRSVLFVNVPIGTVAAILSQKYLANNPGRAMDKHLDLPGALSVTSGLILLVYALTNAANAGFTSTQTILPLGLVRDYLPEIGRAHV